MGLVVYKIKFRTKPPINGIQIWSSPEMLVYLHALKSKYANNASNDFRSRTGHSPQATYRQYAKGPGKCRGKPLLQRVVLQLKDAGFTRIVVNVHHFSDQIIDYLHANDNFGMDIRISDETDKLLETGGGIKKAWMLFNPSEPILIHNVDILSNVDLKKFYEAGEGEAFAARLIVSERKTKRYLLFDDTMRLAGWTNIETGEVKSPYSHLDPKKCRMYAFSGIHMVAPSLFPLMDDEPDRFPIMDFYLKHCDKVRIEGYVKNDLQLMDVGKQETLKEAEEFLLKVKR